MRWVSRSAVGSSLALSTNENRLRAVRATASWPSTSTRTMSSALGGLLGASGTLASLPKSAYEPGATWPSERMRSAIGSTAFHSSVYCVMNMVCSVLNIGPVTFQWKLWVVRYSV